MILINVFRQSGKQRARLSENVGIPFNASGDKCACSSCLLRMARMTHVHHLSLLQIYWFHPYTHLIHRLRDLSQIQVCSKYKCKRVAVSLKLSDWFTCELLWVMFSILWHMVIHTKNQWNKSFGLYTVTAIFVLFCFCCSYWNRWTWLWKRYGVLPIPRQLEWATQAHILID